MSAHWRFDYRAGEVIEQLDDVILQIKMEDEMRMEIVTYQTEGDDQVWVKLLGTW